MLLKRMWINQPSSSQPLHHLHGVNVLAEASDFRAWPVYFLSGEVTCMPVPRSCLSEGWTGAEEPHPIEERWAETALDNIDAGFFSGDTFFDYGALRRVEWYIRRWQKAAFDIRKNLAERPAA